MSNRVESVDKSRMEVFDNILNKEKLERADLELVIQKIMMYEDHLDIQLHEDVSRLLHDDALPKKTSTGN